MTSDRPSPITILIREGYEVAPSIPSELIEEIYRIEELVQFDAERPSAQNRIAEAVKAHLDREAASQESD